MCYVNQLVATAELAVSSWDGTPEAMAAPDHPFAAMIEDRGLSSSERLVVVPCAVIRHRQQQDNPGG